MKTLKELKKELDIVRVDAHNKLVRAKEANFIADEARFIYYAARDAYNVAKQLDNHQIV